MLAVLDVSSPVPARNWASAEWLAIVAISRDSRHAGPGVGIKAKGAGDRRRSLAWEEEQAWTIY
jgi:hypothetical protein